MSAPEYGHNPYGAMFDCTDCGQRFRTVERLRDHQDFDQDVCRGRVTEQPRARHHHQAAPGSTTKGIVHDHHP